MEDLEETLKPNDVAIILRPCIEDNMDWDGSYQVMIGGFGPVSMVEEDMQQLVNMAIVLASVSTLLHSDIDTAEIIMEHCKKFYEEQLDSTMSAIVLDKETFNLDSKTQGGMQ
jgi:hypothetical protein